MPEKVFPPQLTPAEVSALREAHAISAAHYALDWDGPISNGPTQDETLAYCLRVREILAPITERLRRLAAEIKTHLPGDPDTVQEAGRIGITGFLLDEIIRTFDPPDWDGTESLITCFVVGHAIDTTLQEFTGSTERPSHTVALQLAREHPDRIAVEVHRYKFGPPKWRIDAEGRLVIPFYQDADAAEIAAAQAPDPAGAPSPVSFLAVVEEGIQREVDYRKQHGTSLPAHPEEWEARLSEAITPILIRVGEAALEWRERLGVTGEATLEDARKLRTHLPAGTVERQGKSSIAWMSWIKGVPVLFYPTEQSPEAERDSTVWLFGSAWYGGPALGITHGESGDVERTVAAASLGDRLNNLVGTVFTRVFVGGLEDDPDAATAALRHLTDQLETERARRVADAERREAEERELGKAVLALIDLLAGREFPPTPEAAEELRQEHPDRIRIEFGTGAHPKWRPLEDGGFCLIYPRRAA